jgi:diguanylate cyclase (GGDEF)-like protein/PAS domain S-box-containing protein
MNVGTDALPTVEIAVSAAAGLSLWLDARRRPGRAGAAYFCFAAVALLWCLGVIVQQALGAPLTGVSVGLTFADLPPLLALMAAVAGVAALMAARAARAGAGWRALSHRAAARPVIPQLVDGYIVASALFVVGWITLFGPEYATSGSGPGAFAVELIRPLAGLVVVGLLLPMTVDVGWQAVPPVAAVLLITLSDALGVSAKLNGSAPGAAQQIIAIAAFAVLGLTPWLTGPQPEGDASSGPPTAATAGAATAGAAALVAAGWDLSGGHGSPAPVIVACVLVVSLAARSVGLAVGSRSAQSGPAPGQRFRDLADLTSDVVLVCELGGIVRYASPAVAEYGYPPENLLGTRIDELIHPEDRPGSRRAALDALGRPPGSPGRFPCRVRAADGTWRHVQSTLSAYRDPAAADQVLITARDVSDQVALRRQVTHLTFHDGLTGLPNRAYLEERAAAALAPAKDEVASGHGQAGAIFLDLDGFTAVNDSVGHHGGDLLLAQAGRRLRALMPAHDTVVRWGSDEFAVLAEEAGTAQEVVDLAHRLERHIAAEPFQVAGRDISLTASVGVAFAGSDPPGFVLRNADVAMARAKELGGGRVEVFATQMHTDVVHRVELTSDLQRAIVDGQLVLEYQPVVELTTSRVSGAEALVRWWRGGAAVPPSDFLGIAEESGLIVPLGDWVLRQACAQAVKWCRLVPDMTVSVNFSPRQVSAEDFADSVLAALAAAGLPPRRLTLEVTERVLVDAAGPVMEHLSELREAGVRLAIDDFGTGYASLANLRRLPVDIVKIDPSFVAGLGEDETLTLLTRTIVQLGRDLGFSVVAEGIESSKQLGLLRDMGCGLGQGYLVAAPMSAAQMESLITPISGQPVKRAADAGGGSAPPDPEAEAVVSLSETQLHRS